MTTSNINYDAQPANAAVGGGRESSPASPQGFTASASIPMMRAMEAARNIG